jgi:membrane associated rhomboid family serine protease
VATAASFGVYALSSVSEGALIAGASGGISAFVVAYALLFPRAKLGILFFFRWLIRFPAWFLGLLWFGLQLLGVGGDLVGSGEGIAYLGHLTGGVVGFVAWLVWKDRMR